jgi:tetratricopeptide (TPR) repeat protein
VRLAERLHNDYPHAVEHHRRLAGFRKIHRGVSSKPRMPSDPVASHRTLTSLLRLWETFARENPSVEAFQADLASINNVLSSLEGGRGAAGEPAAFARAVAYAEKSVAIWEQLSRAHPEISTHRENLARVYGELKWLHERGGKPELAREAAARSMTLRKRLIAEFPDLPAHRVSAAFLLTGAAARLATQEPREAEAAHRQALQAWKVLAANFPAASDYAIEVALAQSRLARLLNGPLKRPDDALQMFRESMENLEKLAADHPEVTRSRSELAFARRDSAEFLARYNDRLGERKKLHLQALAGLNELAKTFPNEPMYLEQAGHSFRYLGWIARDAGRPDDALDNFDQGVAAFQKLAAGNASRSGYYRRYVVNTLQQKLSILDGLRRADDAERTSRRVVELYESLVRDYPKETDLPQHAAAAVHDLAKRRAAKGNASDAKP